MERVRSADGTRISYRSGGAGEPVLFVHGTAASSSDWVFVVRLLRDRFTTVTLDRRGRGASDAGAEPYSIDREAEDIAAVASATGARRLVAHSYGALCAIRALDGLLEMDRVVLYEPPGSVPRGTFKRDGRLAGHVETGRHEEAAAMFLSAASVTATELETIRGSPAWPTVVAAIPTLVRELGEVENWTMPQGPIDVPTLLLLGGETRSPAYLDCVPGLCRAFPQLRRSEIAGQRHLGHVMAAEAFATAVAGFLD